MAGIVDNSFNSIIEKGAQNNAGVRARFYLRPVQNQTKTAAEGRPIFDDAEFIEIAIAGDKDNVIDRPVQDNDKERFKASYGLFKEKGEGAISGTRLSQWPGVTRGQVEELAFFKVYTVEQLAAMSDGNAQGFMGINKLRTAARDFLATAAGEAPAAQLRMELEKRDNELAAQRTMLADMKEQLDQLRRMKK